MSSNCGSPSADGPAAGELEIHDGVRTGGGGGGVIVVIVVTVVVLEVESGSKS